jgi:hypothetical protein
MIKKRITGKRLLLAVLLIVLLAVAHYSGGVLGFHQGYHASMARRDSDAFATSRALTQLRNQDYESAVDLLETRLDSEVIQCDAAKESYRSPYNIFWLIFRRDPQVARSQLLASVAEYRTKHPSISTLPEVRQRIAAILKEASSKPGK